MSVSDGPFIEGKELVPGFTIIDVESREAAVDWGGRLLQCIGSGAIRVTEVLMPSMEE